MQNLHRIAVFRALYLGDMLCTVPALRALRARYPQARITLIGLPWAHDFVNRYPRYLDDFLEFPGYPGLPEREPRVDLFPSFVAEAQRRNFDLVIQLHGSGSYVNSLIALFGARWNAGYTTPSDYCPDPDHFLPYMEYESEVRRWLRLMTFLGCPDVGEDLDFPIHHADKQVLDSIPELRDLQKDFVCVHPGARWPSRRWNAQGFAAVADQLSRQGFTVVLTGSPDEVPLVAEVAQRMEEHAINTAGRTPLGALAALLSRARLLVCNDTGVSHVAAALRTPSVVIGLGSDLARWAPLDTDLHRVVSAAVSCRPCEYRVCPIGHPCSEKLEPQTVLCEVDKLLHHLTIPY